jgi:hypothetical protein
MNFEVIAARDVRQAPMMSMGRCCRSPIKIEAGLSDKRIDNLFTDVVRQFINAGLDIFALHAYQENRLPLKPRVLTELLHQVWNKGIFQPVIEGKIVYFEINTASNLISSAG